MVVAAMRFADATSAEPSLTAAEGYKTPEKEKEITEELKEKCYHWMTHVKESKDSTNEYDAIFVLNHKANFEGLKYHFLSLMPEQHVESTVVNAHCMILNDIKCLQFQEEIHCVLTDIMFILENHSENYIDPKTNKAYRMDVDQYAHYCHFLDKRKLASHPFMFVPIYNGGHWWLWIAEVQKKNMNKVQFIVVADLHSPHPYVFTLGINNLPDEGLCWGETLNGGRRGRKSRAYQAEWSMYKEEIDTFRREYGPNILLHKLNKIRDQVIRESEAIRLPKSSAALSSPFCKFTSGDIDSSE
ncbi:hypothetical protein Ahy_A05g024851 [Arachis hypogaea]|uniref:Ubiquitin-like protease family profile domain-containing protein n=1 Tax=Arachis hypogaea TaxID=3818 RepID=A0A445D775_ARAHY|nr:hypothetical protein Ahy_A05g024851 [Arachis hypogaea]